MRVLRFVFVGHDLVGAQALAASVCHQAGIAARCELFGQLLVRLRIRENVELHDGRDPTFGPRSRKDQRGRQRGAVAGLDENVIRGREGGANAERTSRVHDEVRCMRTSVSSPPHVHHPDSGRHFGCRIAPAVNPLEEAIRRLPAGVEFLVVVTWAFGLPVFASIMALGTPGDSSAAVFTNAELLATIIFEVVQLGFLTWFLRIRGWTLEKFGLSFSWRGTAAGVVLLAITYGLAVGAEYIAQVIFNYDLEAAARARAESGSGPEHAARVPRVGRERNFRGAVCRRLHHHRVVARRGMWMAINVSVVVRCCTTCTRGRSACMTVVPMGLLYGYVYSRTRQLWPLMVAHVLLDLIGLAPGVNAQETPAMRRRPQ